ncbi:hypothetical protein JI752_018675 [Lysobacter sp. MMG2]|uniref:hypothetical protein n=1 Tax=Lysobacter sp. MMG2 TaxID=2801338 RepID=UPI001C24148B|nr:hypothetical protein [Lysobacter sp. MMG2]MBU8978177.1 hypothetical protein [Lysobacter sp. MMG2]
MERGVKRDLGLSTRNVVEGVGDLIGIVADPFIHAYNWLGEKEPTTKSLIAGQPERRWERQATTREGWGQVLDNMGLPRAETASERVQADVGRALTGTALTMGIGGVLNAGRGAATSPSVANRVGDFLTAQPTLQTVSTATGAGAASVANEKGYGPGVQLAAGLAGGLSPGAISSGTAAATRGLVRGRSGIGMQRAIEDFGQLGTSPSVGQASGNRAVQGVENLLAGSPTSSGVMDRFARKQAADIGEGLQANADGFYRNASSERAGRAVERGISTFAKDVEGKRGQLYRAADALIPPETLVPMSRTRAALTTLTTVPKGAAATGEQFINPQIRSLAERIEQDIAASRTSGPMGRLAPTAGGLGYQTVRDIRTSIGRELADFSLSTDRPTRQLKQVYAALSQDLDEAAKAQGPKAAQAMSRANNYFKMSASRLDQLERIVDKSGGPEKVYAAAMSGTRDGGTTLRGVMQSLDQEGQRAITGAVLKRMGLASAGQ